MTCPESEIREATPEQVINRFWALPDVADLRNTDREWVYFVKAESLGKTKIGRTYRLKWRLIQVQTYCPVQLKLIAVATGPRGAETILHRALADQRLHGEWFAHSERVHAAVEALPKAGLLTADDLQSIVDAISLKRFDVRPHLFHGMSRSRGVRGVTSKLNKLDTAYFKRFRSRKPMSDEHYDTMRQSLIEEHNAAG